MREFCMTLGGIAMCVQGSEPLEAGGALTPFLTADAAPELEITICPGGGALPVPAEPLAGKDLLLYYYRTQEGLVCQSMGRFGPVSSVCWAPGRRRFEFAINERDYPHIFETVEKVLQLFPVRRVLLERQAVLLHASQVALDGRGILFTAPSGTGKTTQARLWRDTLGADIVCNDRVILRRHAEGWKSYGFPVDGDEPAGNWGVHRPAAIVVLSQGPENRVARLRPGPAGARLMSQTVMDVWDGEMVREVMMLWVRLLEEIPVYALSCRPDAGAVETLYQQLRRDGVMP